MNGVNLIISYNDFALGRLEISYLIERLIEYRDLYRNGHKPFIFIDEAHRIFGTNDDLSSILENFVLVTRKLGVGICLVLPEVESLSDKVLSDVKTMLIGKYKGKGAESIINIIGHEEARRIKRLKYNRFTNERQFLFYTQDYEYLMLLDKVYESPCEIHRE